MWRKAITSLSQLFPVSFYFKCEYSLLLVRKFINWYKQLHFLIYLINRCYTFDDILQIEFLKVLLSVQLNFTAFTFKL